MEIGARGPAALETHLVSDRVRLFDVGARGGIDPRWVDFYPYLGVSGFEPDPAECDRLNRESDSLPYPARFLPYALGRNTRDGVTFYVERTSPVRPMELVRTPGLRREVPSLDGVGPQG